VLSVAELEAAEAALWYDEQRLGLGDECLAELDRCYDAILASPDSYPPLEY